MFLPKWTINNRINSLSQTWVSAIFQTSIILSGFLIISRVSHGETPSFLRSSNGPSSAVASSRVAQPMPSPQLFRWIWGSIRGCRASGPSPRWPASSMVLGPWGQRWGSIWWECSVRLGLIPGIFCGNFVQFGWFWSDLATQSTQQRIMYLKLRFETYCKSTQDVYGWKSVFLFLLICLASAFALSLLRLFKVQWAGVASQNLTWQRIQRIFHSSEPKIHVSISFLYLRLEGRCWPRMNPLLPNRQVSPFKFHAWDDQNNIIHTKNKKGSNIFLDQNH